MLNVQELSYWERKSFFDNIDFAIIGAGIVGYSTALHLRELHPEANIVVLERGFLPSGASSKNAGFACFGSASEIYDDIQNFGETVVWETVTMRWKGLQYLRSIIGDDYLKLEINGSWDLITDEELGLFEKVKEQLPLYNKKLAEITGEENVYSIDDNIKEKFGFERVRTSFYNRLEGQIDTASMNKRFHQLVIKNNIQVLFGISVDKINTSVLNTSIGAITAKKIVICTNGFASQFIENNDIHPARAQVIITKEIPELKIKGTFHYQMGYYYFRNIDDRILFGGGRNLDFTGETTTELETSEQIQKKLQSLLKTVILPETDYEIEHSWAGVMGVGATKKPIIKELRPNIYCGVRLGGMGVAIGSLVGKQLSDLMK